VAEAGDHNGSRLARARHRRRWSQERLARETGFSTSAIRAFEQGRRSLDSMRQLLLFARVLDVPVTDLTGQPYIPASPEQDAGHGAVAAIRRELMLAGRPAKPTDERIFERIPDDEQFHQALIDQYTDCVYRTAGGSQ
jgi:transcriptional regulator with XRE-family HTH domain